VRRTLEHFKRHSEAALGVLAHASRVTSQGSAIEGHARCERAEAVLEQRVVAGYVRSPRVGRRYSP
jgi:hypothetical protein